MFMLFKCSLIVLLFKNDKNTLISLSLGLYNLKFKKTNMNERQTNENEEKEQIH